jgi:hypothetical protein
VDPSAPVNIPATLDELKQLKSSIMPQMQAMLAGFIGPKENPIPSVVALPQKLPP